MKQNENMHDNDLTVNEPEFNLRPELAAWLQCSVTEHYTTPVPLQMAVMKAGEASGYRKSQV